MFTKVLIANRGEIAVRIIRACEELGIATVAVYSDLDRDAVHVKRAGEAYRLGPGPAAESYLAIPRLLEAVQRSGAQAVHPGYGFLAENAAFAVALEERGIGFIGPPSGAIEAMGSKTRARALMSKAGVPIVPGTIEPVATIGDARELIAETIGYPVAVKAAGGGGGKGFRVARGEDELAGAFEGAAREGEKFFSDPTVYLERYLPDPRHIEVQVLADAHGNVIHLGERDCSLQRRHQKLIEEAPAPAVDAELRARIGRVATEAAAAVGYSGAGTVEGLLTGTEPEGASGSERTSEYFFLEMNTRVQVEHCVTEMVTGIDIVKEGIRIAAGEPLSIAQRDVVLRGHAIECRINAEDASRNFAPAPGVIAGYKEPAGPGVRVDSGVGPGSRISPMYDPMLAKLIVWDADREQATARMVRALREYEIEGLPTLLPFHEAILQTRQWADAETCRDLIEDREWRQALAFAPGLGGGRAGSDSAEEMLEQAYTVEVSGKRFEVKVIGPPPAGGGPGLNGAGASRGVASVLRPPPRRAPRAGVGIEQGVDPGDAGGGSSGGGASAGGRASEGGGARSGGDALCSPIQGTVLKVAVRTGADVQEGALVCVVEAMKMENEITAHKSGTIVELPVAVGASIATGDTVAVISSG
ncbi:MAG: acetyl/propionyl/methylcrotonyl-CoA carboxylase subunit alpha [Solirubrobacteraceae bacterium]